MNNDVVNRKVGSAERQFINLITKCNELRGLMEIEKDQNIVDSIRFKLLKLKIELNSLY